MADILRITTPLVNKSQAPDAQKALEATQPFDLHNITRVTKPAGQEGILRQNTGLNQQEETSALLLNLLKDPSVAASSLKNIYLLQELIKLLPVNNKPLTQEIQQLFDQLMVAPEDIADEMMRQENASTSFKGEMFDFLRELLSQNPKQEGLRQATVYFLKAFNSYSMREPCCIPSRTAWSFSRTVSTAARRSPRGWRRWRRVFVRRTPRRTLTI